MEIRRPSVTRPLAAAAVLDMAAEAIRRTTADRAAEAVDMRRVRVRGRLVKETTAGTGQEAREAAAVAAVKAQRAQMRLILMVALVVLGRSFRTMQAQHHLALIMDFMRRVERAAQSQAREIMVIEQAAAVQRVQIRVAEQRGQQTLEAAAVEQKNVHRATMAVLEL